MPDTRELHGVAIVSLVQVHKPGKETGGKLFPSGLRSLGEESADSDLGGVAPAAPFDRRRGKFFAAGADLADPTPSIGLKLWN